MSTSIAHISQPGRVATGKSKVDALAQNSYRTREGRPSRH
jgi:hypothetical protein